MEMQKFTERVGGLTVMFLTALGAIVLVLSFVVGMFVLTSSAYAQEVKHEVVLGQRVETDNALLCSSLDAAKTISDIEDDAEVNMIAGFFIASDFCRLAEGSMVVDNLVYKGKAFNVFSAHDSVKKFYWVTVTKAQAI